VCDSALDSFLFPPPDAYRSKLAPAIRAGRLSLHAGRVRFRRGQAADQRGHLLCTWIARRLHDRDQGKRQLRQGRPTNGYRSQVLRGHFCEQGPVFLTELSSSFKTVFRRRFLQSLPTSLYGQEYFEFVCSLARVRQFSQSSALLVRCTRGRIGHDPVNLPRSSAVLKIEAASETLLGSRQQVWGKRARPWQQSGGLFPIGAAVLEHRANPWWAINVFAAWLLSRTGKRSASRCIATLCHIQCSWLGLDLGYLF
jgi:hypothetical protein